MKELCFLSGDVELNNPLVILEDKLLKIKRRNYEGKFLLNGKRIPYANAGIPSSVEKEYLCRHKHLFLGEKKTVTLHNRRVPASLETLIASKFAQQINREETIATQDFCFLAEKYFPSTALRKIFSKASPFEKTLKDLGKGQLLLFNNQVYSLAKWPLGQLEIEGRKYSVTHLASFDKFSDLYVKNLNNDLRDISKEDIFSSVEQRVINQTNASLSLSAEGKETFLGVRVRPYAIRTNNNIYLFDGFVAECKVKAENNVAVVFNEPIVASPINYEHPFIFSSGGFCFNGPKRWKDLGFTIGEPFYGTKEDISEKLAQTMSQIVSTSRTGYSRSVSPVTPIKNFGHRLISERDAIKRGVRIYENNH